MIALCPNCRARIHIELGQVIDRNLVRCSECWFVFIVESEEIRQVEQVQKKNAKLSMVVGEDLSQRFASWEQRALAEKDRPLLEDVSVSRPFDWTGFDEGAASEEVDDDSDVGEGTILSYVKEKPTGVGEVYCTLSVVDGPYAGLTIPVQQKSIVIGREQADVVVSDPEVSRQHARIRVQNENGGLLFEIEDLGSTNGTIINGTRVECSPLENCDEIRVGGTRVIFFVGRPVVITPRPALDVHALEKLAETSAEAKAVSRSPVDDEGTQPLGEGNPFLPQRLPSRLRASLRVVGGPDAGLELDFPKGAMVIGRDQADVRLRDPQVSRKHALVEILAQDQIYLKDLASKNGTVVNGILVKVARLQSGDSIEVGDTKLLFSAETVGQ